MKFAKDEMKQNRHILAIWDFVDEQVRSFVRFCPNSHIAELDLQ